MDYSKNLSILLKSLANIHKNENKNQQNDTNKKEETLFDKTNDEHTDDLYGGIVSISTQKKEEPQTEKTPNQNQPQTQSTSNLSKLLKSLSAINNNRNGKDTTSSSTNITQNTQNTTPKPSIEQNIQQNKPQETTNNQNNKETPKVEEQKNNNVQSSQANSLSNLLNSLSKINSNKTENQNTTTKPNNSTSQNQAQSSIAKDFETITSFSKTFKPQDFSTFKLQETFVEDNLSYQYFSNISTQKINGKEYKKEENLCQIKNEKGEVTETLLAKVIYNENNEIFSVNFSLYDNKNKLTNGYSIVVYEQNNVPKTQINTFANGELSTKITNKIPDEIVFLQGYNGLKPIKLFDGTEQTDDTETDTKNETENKTDETDETNGQTKAELFPTETKKDITKEKDLVIDEFKQGSLDDCYFISHLRKLGSLENTDILQWNEDGSATVKLYDVKWINYQESFMENYDGINHDLIVGERREYTITPNELNQTTMMINGVEKTLLTGDITMKAMEVALAKHAMQKGNFDYSNSSMSGTASGLLFGKINYTANAGCYDNYALEGANTCGIPPREASKFREHGEDNTNFRYSSDGKYLNIQDTSGNTVKISEKHSYAILEYNQNKNTVTISDPHYTDSKIEINANSFKEAFSINTNNESSKIKTLYKSAKIVMGL